MCLTFSLADRFFILYAVGGAVINKKFDRRLPEKKDKTEINEMIKDKEVRLIGSDGNQVGVVPIEVAMAKAIEEKMDLVKIAPQANPPVTKIMDYGKHRYEQQKKDKEARKKQKTIQVKEVRLSLKIEKHDLETKANHARKFLKAGDKVKISLRLRGREMANASFATEVIDRLIESIGEDLVVVDQSPKQEGRFVNAIISPSK